MGVLSMKPIEFNQDSALAALDSLEKTVASGERPRVLFTDIKGLSPAFVEQMQQSDHIDVEFTDYARSQFADEIGDETPHAGKGLLYAVAASVLLMVAGMRVLLS